jgi:hypothetical protein
VTKKKPAFDYADHINRSVANPRKKKPARGKRNLAGVDFEHLHKEARASCSLDGETRSGCPTCGACSPPMTPEERAVIEAALLQLNAFEYSVIATQVRRIENTNVACRALRSSRKEKT